MVLINAVIILVIQICVNNETTKVAITNMKSQNYEI